MNKTRLAVFVSGSGTNLQAIIDSKIQDVEISVVVSNKRSAYALERARKHGIPVEIIENKRFSSRKAYDTEIVERLEPYGIDLIVLAGFMRVLSPVLINRYTNRIMNIHPAILPSFPGLNAVKQAFDYGVKYCGCTVHFVDAGVDTGPVIVQASVPVLEFDTLETLTERIHKEEHRIYPLAIELFAQKRISVSGRKVNISDVRL